MTAIPNAERDADELLWDAGEDTFDESTLDDIELSADLAAIRLASTSGDDWRGMAHE